MKSSQTRWLLRQGIDTIRYEGLHILLWRMLRLGLSPFCTLAIDSFCRKDLSQPLGETRTKTDLAISQATEADIDQLVALATKRYGPEYIRKWFKSRSIEETVREQFKKNAKCFVGRIGTEMVAYNWLFFHQKEWSHGHYVISLHDDEALCDDAFTVEELRGKGIHGAIHNQMLLFLKQSGFRTAYTVVHTDNISSKKALKRLGWNFYGTLLYFSPHKSDKVLMWQLRGPLEPFVAKGIRKPQPISKT
jgi:RimJ/RimL family protein N-acetyltransferase